MISIAELMSASKAGTLFPGVVISEWSPSEEEDDSNVARISFVSSVGSGIVKIKIPENLMLPLAYLQH